MSGHRDERVPVVAVGLLSAASLGFEILLLRWFAVLYWHHFAHMIISVALLGLGMAGSILTLSQRLVLPLFKPIFAISAAAFAISMPMVVSAVGRIGFNPLEVVWDPGQGVHLARIFLVSAIPFVFSGFGIGLALRRFPGRVGVLYRADLAGAAVGAMTVPLILLTVSPVHVVRWLAVPALLGAVSVAGLSRRSPSRGVGGSHLLRWFPALVALAAGIGISVMPLDDQRHAMSPYKALPQTLRIPGVRQVAEAMSPAGIAIALASDTVPFRYAPGLSMLAPAEPPAQTALFLDGHAAGVIDHGEPDARGESYLDWTPAALPYRLISGSPRVLILGAGGGNDVRHAMRAGAARIDAVEASGALRRAARDRQAATGQSIAILDAARWTTMDPRSYLAATRQRYDVIQITPFGTAAPVADAAQAMREHYLYTLEGVRLMLQRLSPDGLLAITMPVDLPPRAPVKLLATLAAAATDAGVEHPADHVAAIRSWNTVTIVFSRGVLGASQRKAVEHFCAERAFDLIWIPGIEPGQVNRANVLDHPFYYEAAREILQGDGDAYIRRYPFYVRPATDDKPYFGRYFRWRSFPAWWTDRLAGAAPFLEWSYLLAWMLVGAALVLAVPLIGLPLRPLARRLAGVRTDRGSHSARAVYFACLGLAFLSLEIVFIQKFVLFLGHPVVAMAVVVPAFLAFAGLGSGWSERLAVWRETVASHRRIPSPVMLVALVMAPVTLGYIVGLPWLFRWGAGWPAAVRILVSIMLIGGLAVWMGFPFPLGLRRLSENRPAWIPLAWGINGLASVLSAVGTGLLALHAGFRVVALAALVLYFLAASLERRL